jgi:hypothetical protein
MKEKPMYPYFPWWEQQPGSTVLHDKRNSAKMEDQFYAQFGAPSIKARVGKALELFASKTNSNCKVQHSETQCKQ